MSNLIQTDKIDSVAAKAKHYVFKNKMRAYLDGSTEVEENILADHSQCGLGKWISGVGRRKYSQYPALEELDKIHQSIHEVAKVIIDLKNKGLEKEARGKMDDINRIGVQIIAKITELENNLDNN